MNLKAISEVLEDATHVTPEQVRSVANAAAEDLDAAARTTKGFIDRLTATLEAASERIQALEDAIAKFKVEPAPHVPQETVPPV
jgi:ABC-type transporter Mla subunit MlaD